MNHIFERRVYGNIKMILVLYILALFPMILASKKPNIILVLTDDQDLLLGGMTPMKQVQQLVANQGATFKNAFVSTPFCCPSRSSILTGLYMHNHLTINNSLSGGCSGQTWQRALEPATFGAVLHSAGYRTFYAGKYLNAYGFKSAGGTEHVPVGWDWWIGLVGNSRYYNYTLSINGTGHQYTDQYLTHVIRDYALEFLESVRNSNDSFLMVLATPAPHTPYIPEPKYKGRFQGIKVPRTPNFNTHKLKDRHWLLNMEPSPLPDDTVALVDDYYARRWETLLSVDDMVAATVNKLQDIGQLNNSYIIYTSDHGYHLGHYALPWDKRQPYETDIRVPLIVKGPGISPKSLVEELVVNIDIAPTIVDMAGLPEMKHVDGWSFLSYAKQTPTWSPHEYFNVEYIGEGASSTVSPECFVIIDNTLSECYPSSSCKCQDSRNNTYDCIRRFNSNENTLFCEFYKERGGHREFYDINKDPYQLNNTFMELSPCDQDQLRRTQFPLHFCDASSCSSRFPIV